MKSSIKKLKNCKHIIDVTLPPERVKEEFDKAYHDIGKVASVPGFRVGRAPRDLLEKHYAKAAREEVIKKLVPETYRDILEKHKLDPIGYPDISEVKLDVDGGFSYKASIETRPEIVLKNYKGLKLKKKVREVNEEDVGKNLEYLRESHAQVVPKKDSEEKEKVLPNLDDEFAKDLGFENLEKLKDAVKEDLKAKIEEDIETDLELELIDRLLDAMDFEAPETLVNAERDRLLKDANMRLKFLESVQEKENPDKKFTLTDQDKKELEENSYKQAVKQVKAFFILDKIASVEKIYIKEEDLDKYIEALAAQYKKTKEEIKSYLEKEHKLDEIAVNMRNRKAVEFLLKEAKIE